LLQIILYIHPKLVLHLLCDKPLSLTKVLLKLHFLLSHALLRQESNRFVSVYVNFLSETLQTIARKEECHKAKELLWRKKG